MNTPNTQTRLSRALLGSLLALGLVSVAFAQRPVAEVSPGSNSIQVRVVNGNEALFVLASDTGFRHEARIPAGQTIQIPMADAKGRPLGDGFYTWEVRLLSPETGGTKSYSSVSSPASVESGSFRVQDARVEVVGGHRSELALGDNPFAGSGAETVFTDNISARAACFSSDANCADPEPLGIIDVKLKGNIPLIRWERTGAGDKTWDIDVDLGGFRIAQVTDGRAPMLIADAAPTNSIRVDGFGRVGFGTSLPSENLHVVDSSDSSLRLQVGGQAWDIFTGSGSTSLRVFNATGGGIPMVIATNGTIAFGASTPSDGDGLAENFVDVRSSQDARVVVDSGDGAGRFGEFLFQRNNVNKWSFGNENSRFYFYNYVPGPGNGYVMTIDNANSNVVIAKNLTVNGTFSNPSSREIKNLIAGVDGSAILSKLSSLPLFTWSYKTDESVRHFGPVAEDFYERFRLGLDEKHISPNDMAGVALAATQALHEIVREKDAKIQALEERLERLERRLD